MTPAGSKDATTGTTTMRTTPTPTTTLRVKVVPGARHDRVVGRLGDAVKVHVSAPPEKGKANDAVCALLADFFGVDRAAVSVTAGHASPRKVVTIAGLDRHAIVDRLEQNFAA
jgi:uncharacterized protein